jgi:hypothetical protein
VATRIGSITSRRAISAAQPTLPGRNGQDFTKKAKAESRETRQNIQLVVMVLVVVAAALAAVFGRSSVSGSSSSSGSLQPAPRCGSYASSCKPRQCGHVVLDDFATAEEAAALLAIAEKGMALGGGAGGPTILDLQSGALSYGDKFIDVWVAFNSTGRTAFRRSEVAVYAEVVERIRLLAERTFGFGGGAGGKPKLHLTAPTFFSRISGAKKPKTAHDEYWHPHIDLEQYGSFAAYILHPTLHPTPYIPHPTPHTLLCRYGSFVFTSLLYLADAGAEFEGGAFELLPMGTKQGGDGPGAGSGAGAAGAPVATIVPKRGRLVLFFSGSEHPHRVTRVTSGTRLALTIAFTCDESAAIVDFLGRSLPDDEGA